jgi:hypothetical protein
MRPIFCLAVAAVSALVGDDAGAETRDARYVDDWLGSNVSATPLMQ